jgi:hypothetical protein
VLGPLRVIVASIAVRALGNDAGKYRAALIRRAAAKTTCT